MPCNCNSGKTTTYKWTSGDGSQTKTFTSEAAAQLQKSRYGGNYTVVHT